MFEVSNDELKALHGDITGAITALTDPVMGSTGVEAALILLRHALTVTTPRAERLYDPARENEPCECGHPYYRHFDWMEDMEMVGCKYCGCYTPTPAEKKE